MKSYEWDETLQLKQFYLRVICCPKLINGHEIRFKTMKCDCNKRGFG